MQSFLQRAAVPCTVKEVSLYETYDVIQNIYFSLSYHTEPGSSNFLVTNKPLEQIYNFNSDKTNSSYVIDLMYHRLLYDKNGEKQFSNMGNERKFGQDVDDYQKKTNVIGSEDKWACNIYSLHLSSV